MIVNYPSEAFCFNPILIKVSDVNNAPEVLLTCNGVSLKRKVIDNAVTFDIQSIAQGLFNFKDYMFGVVVEDIDKTLIKELTFTVTDGYTAQNRAVIVRWGALQVGSYISEYYYKKYVLRYFKKSTPTDRQLPFTVPINSIDESGAQIYVSNDGKPEVYSGFDINGLKLNIPYNFENTIKEAKFIIYEYSQLDVRVRITNCTDGIYLRWLNNVGDWCYYLLSPANSSIAVKSVDNIDLSYESYRASPYVNKINKGTSKPRTKNVVRKQKLFASLIDKYDFELLQSLVESVYVDVYTGNGKGYDTWLGVNISDGTFTQSKDNLQDFECEMIYPEINQPSL